MCRSDVAGGGAIIRLDGARQPGVAALVAASAPAHQVYPSRIAGSDIAVAVADDVVLFGCKAECACAGIKLQVAVGKHHPPIRPHRETAFGVLSGTSPIGAEVDACRHHHIAGKLRVRSRMGESEVSGTGCGTRHVSIDGDSHIPLSNRQDGHLHLKDVAAAVSQEGAVGQQHRHLLVLICNRNVCALGSHCEGPHTESHVPSAAQLSSLTAHTHPRHHHVHVQRVLHQHTDRRGGMAEADCIGTGAGHGQHGQMQHLPSVVVMALILRRDCHRLGASRQAGGVDAPERAVGAAEARNVSLVSTHRDGIVGTIEAYPVPVLPNHTLGTHRSLVSLHAAKTFSGNQDSPFGNAFPVVLFLAAAGCQHAAQQHHACQEIVLYLAFHFHKLIHA